MKIYTKTGDQGETGLLGGVRVRKDDPRIETLGSIDELNAAIGLALTASLPKIASDTLSRVQSELFDLGAGIASAGTGSTMQIPQITLAHIERLEAAIDATDGQLPSLQNFILPGGSLAAAQLHFSRSVCRHAERQLVQLSTQVPIANESIVYLNRLSDLLFVLARVANMEEGIADIPWKSSN